MRKLSNSRAKLEMFGFYTNFPENLHYAESFTYSLSRKSLQQRLLTAFHELNCATLTFEEIGSPAVPRSSVIFEIGIAEGENFTFLNEAETKKMLATISRAAIRVLDIFCAIRYYKNHALKKTPLKFDYFMLRLAFGKEKSVELQVFHERGPRYISPDELSTFLVHKVNSATPRKILKSDESF